MDSKKEPASSVEQPVPPTGLKAEATSFMRNASAYFQLRSQLFSIEAKEAGQVYGKKTRLLIAGAVMLALAYLLIVASLIGIISAVLDPDASLTFVNWIGASLLIAGVHLLFGLIALKKGRKLGSDQSFFQYTRNELQKEQEWLKQTKKP